MATIAEEREAIAEVARRLPDLTVYSYWPDNFECPCLLIKPARQEYDAFRSPYRVYELELLFLLTDSEPAQVEMDRYLEDSGEYSIREVFDSDPTLNGTVGNSSLGGWANYAGRRTETAPYIGVTWELEVYS